MAPSVVTRHSAGSRGELADGETAEAWLHQRALEARQGHGPRFTTKFVEAATDGLPPACYREEQGMRTVKRDLGLRRGKRSTALGGLSPAAELSGARHRLAEVSSRSPDMVLRVAARSLLASLE